MSELSRREALKVLGEFALGLPASKVLRATVGEQQPKPPETVQLPMGYGIRLEVNPFSRKSSQVLEQAGWPATYDRLQQTTTTVDLAHGLEQAVLSPFQALDLVVYENAAAEQLAQYRWQAALGDWTVVNYQYVDFAQTTLTADELERAELVPLPATNLVAAYAGTSAVELTLETDELIVTWTIKNDGKQGAAFLQGGTDEERGDYVLTIQSKNPNTAVWQLEFGVRVTTGKTDMLHALKALLNRVPRLKYHEDTDSVSSSTRLGSLHTVNVFPLRINQNEPRQPISFEQLRVITDAIATFIRSDSPARVTMVTPK